MVQILDRLREIETAVVNRAPQEEPHVGSIKFLSTNKRKHGIPSPVGYHRGSRHNLATRRIPSFGMGVRVGHVAGESPHPDTQDATGPGVLEYPSEDEEDEELEAILARNGVNLKAPDEDYGSWRLEGWMKEYADRVPPPGSSAFATDHGRVWPYLSMFFSPLPSQGIDYKDPNRCCSRGLFFLDPGMQICPSYWALMTLHLSPRLLKLFARPPPNPLKSR
jgi:hypothetical protein